MAKAASSRSRTNCRPTPPMRLTETDARALLNRQLDTAADASGKVIGLQQRKGAFSAQHDRAMKISKSLWGNSADRSASACVVNSSTIGRIHPLRYSQHKRDKKKAAEHLEHTFPYRGATAPRAELYGDVGPKNIDDWLVEVSQREVRPND